MPVPLAKPIKRVVVVVALLAVISALCLAAFVASVNISSRAYRKERAEDLPPARVAIIFGANVYRSGRLSPILQDRVDAGIELYRAGTVKKLLMTGDNGTPDYNEVAAMKAYALDQGVSEEDITLDYAGFSTYDSCYRAKNIFGLEQAILVTQRYHAPRAAYTCRSVGIDAVAYALEDFSKYPDLRLSYSAREYLADVKAGWQLKITREPAAVMGAREPEI